MVRAHSDDRGLSLYFSCMAIVLEQVLKEMTDVLKGVHGSS